MPRTIQELLKMPFGPYQDADVLAETLKSTKTKMLGLRNVHLSCRGEPTGLTKCEQSQPEFETGNSSVVIEGILTIQKLAWLSLEGQKLVQKDLRERDGPHSTFTLRNLYGRSKLPAVKIRIRAHKNMAAVYAHTSELPYGLFVKTEDRYRGYEVISMDASTYRLSHLYLSRYRTLRVLMDVVKYDSDHSDVPTPTKLRNPKWFAAMYLRTHRRAQNSTTIHLSSDSEQSESEEEADSHLVRLNVARPVYHRTRAEILVLIATHAKWLVEDQTKRKKGDRYFDIDVWQQWVFMVDGARKRARGRRDEFLVLFADGEESQEEGGRSVEEDDMLRQESLPPHDQTAKRKATPLARGSTAYSSRSSVRPRTPSPLQSMYGSPAPNASPHNIDTQDDPPGNDYDFDFSPSSDSNWEDSDASLPARPPTPPSPSLLRNIPYVFLHCPKFPKHSFKWSCPLEGCTYSVDLLRPTDEEWKDVPAYAKPDFDEYKWSSRDGWVKQYFYRIVSRHWMGHLHEKGIDVHADGKNVKFEWSEGKLLRRRAGESSSCKPEQNL